MIAEYFKSQSTIFDLAPDDMVQFQFHEENVKVRRAMYGPQIPLLGKGGARGGSANFQNDSAWLLTGPPLTPPLPRRGICGPFIVAT